MVRHNNMQALQHILQAAVMCDTAEGKRIESTWPYL